MKIQLEELKARNAALEEAARVASTYPDVWEEPDCAARDIRRLAAAEIAASIRSLKSGEQQ
jgi:hypothetical protein